MPRTKKTASQEGEIQLRIVRKKSPAAGAKRGAPAARPAESAARSSESREMPAIAFSETGGAKKRVVFRFDLTKLPPRVEKTVSFLADHHREAAGFGFILFIALVLFVSPITLPRGFTSFGAAYYYGALDALRGDNLVVAERFFARAFERDPENFNYLWQLAVTQAKQGKYDEAIKSYEQLRPLVVESPLVYLEEGEVMERAGRIGEAKDFYRKTIQLDPAWVKPYTALFAIAFREGDRAAALGALEEGLRANPESEELRALLETYAAPRD